MSSVLYPQIGQTETKRVITPTNPKAVTVGINLGLYSYRLSIPYPYGNMKQAKIKNMITMTYAAIQIVWKG